MKTIYLHIGSHKTGTSTLQLFLEQNSNALLRKRFAYPKLPGYHNHCNGVFLFTSPQSPRFVSALNMIKTTFKCVDSIIISHENLSYNFVYNNRTPSLWTQNNKISIKDNIQEFKRICDENNYDLKIVVFLRRQDLFIESFYNELIKECGCFDSINVCIDRVSLLLHYDRWVSDFGSIVGENNMIVKSYDSLIDNDIVKTFCKIIGVKLGSNFKTIKNQNKRLELNALYIKNIYNKLNYDSLGYEKVLNFSNYLLNAGFHHFDGYSVFSKKEAKKLVKEFKKENRNLSIKYNNSIPLFNADFSMYKHVYDSDNKYMIEDLNSLLKYITENK